MLSRSLFSEAVQIGPWRIARKHLLFVIFFGIVIVCFGFVILHTHIFSEDEEESEDENENGWGSLREKLSNGDWVLIIIMILAGILSLSAGFTCLFVKKNSPVRLSHSQKEQPGIYSVQFDNRRRTEATAPSYSEREISIFQRSNSNSNIQSQTPILYKEQASDKIPTDYLTFSHSHLQNYTKTDDTGQTENKKPNESQQYSRKQPQQTARDVQVLSVQKISENRF
ncbi:UNVERIFIED_CONTAM: hypothetical protein RMT77_003767 [Armadillidium vulgare]